jgi:ferritin-like metal-binding protein YciE
MDAHMARAGTAQAHTDLLLAWLNDAYAMERSFGVVLEDHLRAAAHHPALRARLRAHRDLAAFQADRVKSCIERLGGRVSGHESAVAAAMGVLGMAPLAPSGSTGIGPEGGYRDELVRITLAAFSAESFQIASYRALVAAAQAIPDAETLRVCQEILAEEEEMAAWLTQRLPAMVLETLNAQR